MEGFTMRETPKVLLDGLTFPEGPRWHEGRLWFSDFYAHEVIALSMTGERETIVEVPGQPSGLGWTPDGRLLVVSMTDRRLLRLDPDGLVEVANLWDLAGFHCNDMVVDGDGGAYVGNFGYNSHDGSPFEKADLIRVDPDGTASVAATGLAFPNGSVITPDGSTLIVGETRGNILSAWDRHADGSLHNRRVWADLNGGFPDGICLDAEGAVWVADPRNKETIRVLEGGEVTDRISTGEMGSFACMLGGPDRRTLFICTCLQSGPGTAELRSGRIETITVKVPGAGWP
jgi:sugar lactone lactonase YvrE